jgi:aspartyl protease
VGSRRRRYAALAVAAVAALAGCPKTGGGPSGITGVNRDRWTFPLVAPLENGLLVTPVTINDHGPYLFALDPDAKTSVIDVQVVHDGKLLVTNGPPVVDESGTPQPVKYATITSVEIGSVIVESRTVLVVRSGAFDSGARRISGVLGRDIIDDALLFGFDRDRGMAFLYERKGWQPPPGAQAIPFELAPAVPTPTSTLPIPRRLVKATINGEQFTLHLDFGAIASALRQPLWERAKLVSREVDVAGIDEVGVPHPWHQASEPATAAIGATQNDRVVFVPYDDKRVPEGVDGTLALNFFANNDVWIDWQMHTIYLSKRDAVPLDQKLGRWDTGPLGGKCEHPGCVAVRLVDPLGGKPVEEGKQHPGVVLSVQRDERAGGMDLEILLEPKDKPDLPRLIVNLPPNADRLIDHLGPEFLGVELVVIDASPYPRVCPTANGCVDQLAR